MEINLNLTIFPSLHYQRMWHGPLHIQWISVEFFSERESNIYSTILYLKTYSYITKTAPNSRWTKFDILGVIDDSNSHRLLKIHRMHLSAIYYWRRIFCLTFYTQLRVRSEFQPISFICSASVLDSDRVNIDIVVCWEQQQRKYSGWYKEFFPEFHRTRKKIIH